jgi:hypothetical protein
LFRVEERRCDLKNEVGNRNEAVPCRKLDTWFAQKLTLLLTNKECPVDINQCTKKVQNHVQFFKFKLDNNKIRNVID